MTLSASGRTWQDCSHVYDVTSWDEARGTDDLGLVINSILAHIRAQREQTENMDGPARCFDVIAVPPGVYLLKTPVLIGLSGICITGALPLALRDSEGVSNGLAVSAVQAVSSSCHIVVEAQSFAGAAAVIAHAGAEAAFVVKSETGERLQDVELSSLALTFLNGGGAVSGDGAAKGAGPSTGDGAAKVDEASTVDGVTTRNGGPGEVGVTGRKGVGCASAILALSGADRLTLRNMCISGFDHPVTLYEADAAVIENSVISGGCSGIELRRGSIDCLIAGNQISNTCKGNCLLAESAACLQIRDNRICARGRSCVRLVSACRSTVRGNHMTSCSSGMVVLSGKCLENQLCANHMARHHDPYLKSCNSIIADDDDNAIQDDYGLLHIEGSRNTVSCNHISCAVLPERLFYCECSVQEDQAPVLIRLVEGQGNYLADNHLTAMDLTASRGRVMAAVGPGAGAAAAAGSAATATVAAAGVASADGKGLATGSCRSDQDQVPFATRLAQARVSGAMKELGSVVEVLIDETASENTIICSSRKSRTQDFGRNNVLVTIPDPQMQAE